MFEYDLLTRQEAKNMTPFIDTFTPDEMKEYVFSRGYYDIKYFAEYHLKGFGYIFEEAFDHIPFHFVEIWRGLEGNKKQVLIEPRGHGKTTAILIWILHAMVYKKVTSILYLASADLGEKGVGKIRGELETNESILNVFGNLVPVNSDDPRDTRLKRWNNKRIELLNGTYLATMSKNKPIRGQRFKKILVDDPQENKDVKKAKMVEKFNEWFNTTIIGMLMPTGSICVIGTVVGKMALVLHLSKNKKGKKWPTIRHEACDENFEHLLWPEVWNKESLQEKMEDMGTAEFKQEYRHIPKSSEDTKVQESRIRYYDQAPKTFDMIVLGYDPTSTNNDSSDDVGFCSIGVKVFEDQVRYYVLHSKGIKLSPLQQQAAAMKIYDHVGASVMVKEDNIERGITEGIKLAGYNVKGVVTSKDKMTRLIEGSPKIEFGYVYFRKQGDEQLIDQLTSYPDGDHDDVMDAFLIALQYAYSKFGKGKGVVKVASAKTK